MSTASSPVLLILIFTYLALSSLAVAAPGPAADGPSSPAPAAHGPSSHAPAAHGPSSHAPAAHGPSAHEATSLKHPRAASPSESRGPPADISKSCSTAKDKDFCVKTLKSNSQASGKDIKDLTFLSMEIAQNKSSEIDAFISAKLRNEESLPDNTDDALHECGTVYDDATAVIEDAISASFQKNFDDMKKYMKAAMDLGDKCEKEFKDAKMKAVIGDRNADFSKLCGISLALVHAWEKAHN